MVTLEVIDIDTGAVDHVDIPTPINGINSVYRNSRTRELDRRYGRNLADKFTPIPMGSCFTEGNYLLPGFVVIGNHVGFYVGVERQTLPRHADEVVEACRREQTVEVVNHQGRELIIPVDFK